MKEQKLFMEEEAKIHKSRRSYKLTIPQKIICGACWTKINQKDKDKLLVKVGYDFDTGNIFIKNPKIKKIVSIPEYFDISTRVGKRKFNKKELFTLKQSLSKVYSNSEIEAIFIKSGYKNSIEKTKLKINDKNEAIKYLENQTKDYEKAIKSIKKIIKSLKSN